MAIVHADLWMCIIIGQADLAFYEKNALQQLLPRLNVAQWFYGGGYFPERIIDECWHCSWFFSSNLSLSFSLSFFTHTHTHTLRRPIITVLCNVFFSCQTTNFVLINWFSIFLCSIHFSNLMNEWNTGLFIFRSRVPLNEHFFGYYFYILFAVQRYCKFEYYISINFFWQTRLFFCCCSCFSWSYFYATLY